MENFSIRKAAEALAHEAAPETRMAETLRHMTTRPRPVRARWPIRLAAAGAAVVAVSIAFVAAPRTALARSFTDVLEITAEQPTVYTRYFVADAAGKLVLDEETWQEPGYYLRRDHRLGTVVTVDRSGAFEHRRNGGRRKLTKEELESLPIRPGFPTEKWSQPANSRLEPGTSMSVDTSAHLEGRPVHRYEMFSSGKHRIWYVDPASGLILRADIELPGSRKLKTRIDFAYLADIDDRIFKPVR